MLLNLLFSFLRQLFWFTRFAVFVASFLIFPQITRAAATDPYFEKPFSVQVDYQRGIGFVLNGEESGRLTAFSLKDPSQWVAFNVAYNFSDQYFDKVSGQLYIASSHPNEVRIFRSEDITPYLGRGLIDDYAVLPFKVIPLDGYPVLIEGMAFDAEHTRAFVALYGSEGKIAIINSDYSVKYITTGASVYQPIYDRKTGLLSVIHVGAPFISLVDTVTGDITRLELKVPAIYTDIDASRGRLYVLHAAEPGVSVIDLKQRKKTAEVALPAVMPIWIGVNQNSGDLYVSDAPGKSVIILDGDTLRVEKNINLIGMPWLGVIDQDLNIVAISSFNSNIFIIDGNTKKFVKTIPTDGLPQTLALDKPTHNLVAGSFYGDSVTIISLKDFSYRKLGKFSQTETPSYSTRGKYFTYAESLLDVPGKRHEVWVGNRGGFFTVIENGKVTQRVDVSKELRIWPMAPEVSNSTVAPFFYNGKVYAPVENGVAIINAEKKSRIATINLSENFMPVWWLHDGRMLYILDENAHAWAIDLEEGRALHEVSWGGVPGIFVKQGSHLFLANLRSNVLRIFDENLKQIGEITLADLSPQAWPLGIDVNSSRNEIYALFFDKGELRLFAVHAEQREVRWDKRIPMLSPYGFVSVLKLVSDDSSQRLAIISFAGGVQIIDARDGRIIAEHQYPEDPLLPEAFDEDSGTLYLYGVEGIRAFSIREEAEKTIIPFSYNTPFFRETLFTRGKLYAVFAADIVAEIDVATNHSRIFFNPDGTGLSLVVKRMFTSLDVAKGKLEYTPGQGQFVPKISRYLIGIGVFLIAIGILVFVLHKRRQDQVAS